MPVESQRQADGGARDSRARDRRSNASSASSEKAIDKAIPAAQTDENLETPPEERPAARSRRGGRSRRNAASSEQNSALPLDEPAEVS